MPDSTHPARRRHVFSAVALTWACLLAMAMLGPVSGARADGDPASDVLASQPLFVPADGGVSGTQQAGLAAVVSAARRQGYAIRVALIATQADLGSITELWRMPRSYAEFLGQELSLLYRGTLLVVMPNGIGVYAVGPHPSAAVGSMALPPALVKLVPGRSPASAAVTAVRDLAAAAGRPLRDVAEIGRVHSSGSALGSVDTGSWLALAAGAALIAAAWTASLRARPPTRVRRAR